MEWLYEYDYLVAFIVLLLCFLVVIMFYDELNGEGGD